MQYQAVVTTEGDATLAQFPDCPGCATFARAPQRIEDVALEALEGWLMTTLDAGEVPPRPTFGLNARPPRGAQLLSVRVAPALAVRIQIRWARDEQGISQAELARRVGVSQQAIAQFESPDANLRLDTLERIAAALGLTVDVHLVRESAA
ncbi:MAG TPA: type II toxin-antitoxin system HicB family antitoxin [Candidatus Limnocylindria bacterium]|nr:type II toxin-antitoxin system HicB family antitoxin [Candidatus Limnocylindria bacterium]